MARFVRGNVIALLALFLALGGSTYAASSSLIGKNTVASPQVVNGSLQTRDLSPRARKALKGNRGGRGLQGLAGARGATGAQGALGPKGDSGPAIAWGFVKGDGTLGKASSNVTSSWDGSLKRYEIAIAGENYFYANYATIVTPSSSGTVLIPAADSFAGHLVVSFKDGAGTSQQPAAGFQFVTFKP